MALKGNRTILETDITRTCTTVAERGTVLVEDVVGSGIALGDRAGSVKLAANPSGLKVVGLLIGDVVNVDVTRYHLNFHKDETLINQRITLLRKGRVTTNKVTGSPNYGDTAYLDSSGTLIPTAHATGGLVARPRVGQFVSPVDENGYATVDLNLPVI
jgi:hypothetical protein